MTAKSPEDREEEVEIGRILRWTEFCFWTAAILTPILNWWNGPAVSDDQATIRKGIVLCAWIGAVSLRSYFLFRK